MRRASPCPRSSTCPTGQVVTSDFPWITIDLFHEWREFHRPDAPDLWPPEGFREEMDEVMQRVYTEVNNGVYRCGFATAQEASRGVPPAVGRPSTGSRSG